jgi:hypothetical protein
MSWYRIKRKDHHKKKKVTEFGFEAEESKISPEESILPAQPAPEQAPAQEAPVQNKAILIDNLNAQTEQKIVQIRNIIAQELDNLKMIPGVDDNIAKMVLYKVDESDITKAIKDLDKSAQDTLISIFRKKNTSLFYNTKTWNDYINKQYHAIFPEDKFVPGLNFITTPDLIDESELPTLQPSGPSMWAHLPQNKSKEGIESDENVRVLSHNINNLLSQNNISDDEEGARKLFDIVKQSTQDPAAKPLRTIFNYYFAKEGRGEFENLLTLSGFPNLSEEFKKIDENISYSTHGKRKSSEVLGDEVFKDYGLETRSKAEREILSIFRKVNLQPIPTEIKMPSTKVNAKSGVNTEFLCDFLLPCEVFMGFDDQGNPIIRSQVIFVGEYFGYFGQEYKDKTAMKEELEPVQALMTGNDVIFISSEDFASGDNPMKLINQLESKHIIFDGGSAKKTIEKWLSEGNQGRTDVSERIEKLSPEQAFLRSAMLQLQMHYGELKDFYKNYSGDESYREMLKSLFDQYQVLKAQSEELNKRIRNLQYKDSRRSDDKKLHTAEIDSMMDQWRDINNQIKSVYTQNNQLQEIINKHKDTLLNDPDYQARLNDLMTAETLLERGDTLDNVPGETMPDKIKKVCNNSLAGFSSMTRHKAEKVFQPFFNTVQAMFNRYIRVAKTIEFNKIFNKFIK